MDQTETPEETEKRLAFMYKLGADQGDPGCRVSLGAFYACGRGGLPVDPAEAVRLWRLAGNQGRADARFYLARYYEQGVGVAKDDLEAERLYKLAADQGHAEAKENLAHLYERAPFLQSKRRSSGGPQAAHAIHKGKRVEWRGTDQRGICRGVVISKYGAGWKVRPTDHAGTTMDEEIILYAAEIYDEGVLSRPACDPDEKAQRPRERPTREQADKRQGEQDRLWQREQQQRNQEQARAQQARESEEQRKQKRQEQQQQRDRDEEKRQKTEREKIEREKAEQEKTEKQKQQRVRPGANAQTWWVVLGTSPDAPLETVKRAYREKIKQYHPDRVAGLGPEIVELAEHKCKELNAALEEARRLAQR